MAVSFNSEINVSGIFFYDDSAGTYGSNQSGVAAFDYFPDDAAIDDCLYFGFEPGNGFVQSLKLNIGTALVASAITLVWEYRYHGYQAYYADYWRSIPAERLQDTSAGFTNTGIQYIGFNLSPPVDGGGINNWVRGLEYRGDQVFRIWIRCRIAAVTNLTEGGANQTTPVKTYDMRSNITGICQSFDDLVTADKSGTFTLMWPEAAASNLNVYWQPRPQDWGATKLECVITNYSTQGAITLTGTDEADNAVSEDISITGNGTFTSTKNFKTIDADGIDCSGTYTVELRQPRWGTFGRFGTNTWRLSHTVLFLGDGVTETNLAQSKGKIELQYAGLKMTDESSLVLGDKAAVYEYPDEPFMVLWQNTDGPGADAGWITTALDFRDIELYNFVWCVEGSYTYPIIRFQSAGTILKRISFHANSVYYLQFIGAAASGIFSDILACTLYQNTVDAAEWYDLKIKGGIFLGGFNLQYPSADVPQDAPRLIRPEFEDNDRDVCHSDMGNGIVIVNPVNALVTSKLGGLMINPSKVYRIWLFYTVNIRITDRYNEGIENVIVTIKNKDGDEQFSVLTDSEGSINEQDVLSAKWEHIYDGGGWKSYTEDEKTDYNDFTITIDKEGYAPYIQEFTLDAPIDWQISLEELYKVAELEFSKADKLITVLEPYTELSIQQLINEIRDWQDELINMEVDPIINASGKEDLRGGLSVGITLELINDWRLAFTERAGPDTVGCTVWGGNLVATNSYGNNPIKPTAYTQVTISQSTSAALLWPDELTLMDEEVQRILGLVQENQYADQIVLDGDRLLSCRIRIYSDAASVGTDSDVIGTYLMTVGYDGSGNEISQKMVRQ